MKIGILTFHNAHNYGAVLQAYALKTLIRKKGFQVDIINYCNQTIEEKYQKKLQCKFEMIDIIHPGRIFYKLCYKRRIKYMQPQWTNQYEKFEKFISTYLINMPKVKAENIGKMQYDMLIVGSDQIWSEELTGGIDKVYILDFPFEGRRISYAASNANGKVPRNDEGFIEAIKRFEFISTRESMLAQNIRSKADIRVEEVLDPTLLLDKEDYSTLERENGLSFITKNYIFVYYVKEDKKLAECAKAIANNTEMEIIELHYYWHKEYDSKFQFADFGPENFLATIANAKFVITNSFHGTVFSILYRKNFYAVTQKNIRIQNLLVNLGLMNRCIYSVEEVDINEVISYNDIIKKLEKYRENSFRFIENAICK